MSERKDSPVVTENIRNTPTPNTGRRRRRTLRFSFKKENEKIDIKKSQREQSGTKYPRPTRCELLLEQFPLSCSAASHFPSNLPPPIEESQHNSKTATSTHQTTQKKQKSQTNRCTSLRKRTEKDEIDLEERFKVLNLNLSNNIIIQTPQSQQPRPINCNNYAIYEALKSQIPAKHTSSMNNNEFDNRNEEEEEIISHDGHQMTSNITVAPIAPPSAALPTTPGRRVKQNLRRELNADLQWTELLRAVSSGDVALIRNICGSHPDQLNEKEPKAGYMPFTLAAELDDSLLALHCIQILVEYGANIHDLTYEGRSALTIAIMNQHLGVVEYLLDVMEMKVNPTPTPNYIPPIMLAVMTQNMQLIQMLVMRGADLMVQIGKDLGDLAGFRILHQISETGNLRVLQYIYDQLRSSLGEEALSDLVNDRDNLMKMTPLYRAAAAGHASLVEFYIRFGANVNFVCADLTSPLHIAAYRGYVDVVGVLLAAGANIHARNSLGCTATALAVLNKHYGVQRVIECYTSPLFTPTISFIESERERRLSVIEQHILKDEEKCKENRRCSIM